MNLKDLAKSDLWQSREDSHLLHLKHKNRLNKLSKKCMIRNFKVRELKSSLLEKEDHLEEEVEVLRQVISAIIVIKLVTGLMNVILVQEAVDVVAVAAADIDHTGVEEKEEEEEEEG